MVESDIPLWILTAALAGVTLLVWRATMKVAEATKQVAVATKEMTRTTVKPRPTIIHHQKKGEDAEHHHYQFIIKNLGIGDAFDVDIEVLDKSGSSHNPTIPRLKRNQSMAFNANNVHRSKDPITIKISYKDVMDYQYSETIEYDIGNDIFYPQELSSDF